MAVFKPESSVGDELALIECYTQRVPMHVSLQAALAAILAGGIPWLLWAVLAIGTRNRPRLLPLIYPGL
jgi:hypothetical protein